MRLPVPFVFVLGPPGSGKGTQCSLICEKFSSVLHLTAGDLLRKYILDGSDDARRLRKIMNEGQIVPAEVTVGLLQQHLSTTTAPLCLIDGFPRNLENYNCWNKIVARDPRFVVNLTAPQHDLQKRLLSRTGGRSDDNIATIQKRFKTHEAVRPVLDAFESQGKLRKVDGSRPIPDVYVEMRRILRKELGQVLDTVLSRDQVEQ